MTDSLKYGLIGGFVVLLAIAGAVASKLEEKRIGERCETYESERCEGLNAACLTSAAGNYCSFECVSDGDCPTAFRCDDISTTLYEIDPSKGTTTRQSEGTRKMCVKR